MDEKSVLSCFSYPNVFNAGGLTFYFALIPPFFLMQ
ncbi:unnamed protein product, partial [Amoebophrya sp. A25]|eukprot:GSA25T00023321001.1